MNKIKFLSVSLVLCIVISLFAMVTPVQAQGIIIDDGVRKGEKVENNIILTGDDIVLDGDVVGDVVAIGNNFTLNGNVDGSLVVLATESEINGTVGKNLLTAAISVVLGEDADIGWDLYLLSGDIRTDPGSTIGRDLIAYTLGAQLQGDVERNTQGFIGLGPLASILWEQIKKIELPELEFPFNGPTEPGQILFAGPGFGINSISSRTMNRLDVERQQVNPIDWRALGDWALGRLRALVTFIVIGAIFMVLFPRFLEESVEVIKRKPLQSTGMGIVVFVFILASAVLIFALLIPSMLFLTLLNLNWLAAITGTLGYSSLILAMTVFVIYVFYITKVIAGYLAGKVILKRFIPSVVHFRILSLLLGGLILVLLGAIPYLGFILGVWLAILGIGAAWYVWVERRERRRLEASAASPLDASRVEEVELALDSMEVAESEFEPEAAGYEVNTVVGEEMSNPLEPELISTDDPPQKSEEDALPEGEFKAEEELTKTASKPKKHSKSS